MPFSDSERRALAALADAPDWVGEGVMKVLYDSHDRYYPFVLATLRGGGLEALVDGALRYDAAHGSGVIHTWSAVYYQHWEAFLEGSGHTHRTVHEAQIDTEWLSYHRDYTELSSTAGDADAWNRALPSGSLGWTRSDVRTLADDFGVDASPRDPEPGRLLAPNGKPAFAAAAGVGRKVAVGYGLAAQIEAARKAATGHNYRFLVDVPAEGEPGFGAPPPFVVLGSTFYDVRARVGTSPRLEAAVEALAPRAALAELT